MGPEHITDGLHRQRNEGLNEGFSFSKRYASDRWVLFTLGKSTYWLIGARTERVIVPCLRLMTIICGLDIQNQGDFHFLPQPAYVCAIETPTEAFVTVCVAGRRSEARLPQSTEWNRQIGVNSCAFVSVLQWERCA